MKNIRLSDKIIYAQLAFPLAVAGLPLYIHAPDFYAVNFGIGLSFLGIALLMIRLIDAFSDPWIGRLSDHYPRLRIPVMAIASVIFASSFTALYRPPVALEIFWFICTIFLATLSFSVLTINLNAIGGLMARSSTQKTSVSAWREGFGVAGLMAAMLMPAVFDGMPSYATFCAIVAVISATLFIVWLKGYSLAEVMPKNIQDVGLKTLLSAHFSRFLGIYAASMLASSFSAVLFLFYVRDWLGLNDSVGIFLALYFLSAVLAIPAWRAVSAKIATQDLWALSMCASILAISIAAFIQPGDVTLYVIVCILSGAAFGGELSLPPAILSARISQAGLDAHTSSYFGLYAFCMKIALALATAIAFTALDVAGFNPSGENGSLALSTLVGLYAILPAMIKFCAVLVLVKLGDRHEIPFHHLDIGGRHAS